MIKTEIQSEKFDLVPWIKKVWKNEGSIQKLLLLSASLDRIQGIRKSEYLEIKSGIEERLKRLDFIRQEVDKIWDVQ